MSKAVVLLDGGYVDKLQADLGGLRIRYDGFSDKLCNESGGSYRLRTYYYNCPPFQSDPPTIDERNRFADAERFYASLSRLPRFQVRKGKLQRIPDQNESDGYVYHQKRIDVLFSVDLVRVCTERQVDKAVLVTGDSDFVPAIEVARDRGVEVWVWYGNTPNTRVHDELLTCCDERRLLNRPFFDDVLR